ncbi:MAG TPA: PstS family phosphate ABC transporter substrate-binding protein [Pirellulaceae bacterium]|nr:PstS family phosphate ABC transporter substrate-binding protein [Pirellulaceae bacterium]
MIVLAVVVCGCADHVGTAYRQYLAESGLPSPNFELSGPVIIDGSSTVYPITEAAAANFKKVFPRVNVSVGKSGTGGGFKRFAVGETHISDASRPITFEEFQNCHNHDVRFLELPIAYDGLSIVVHPQNDFIHQLTIDQLKRIFLAGQSPQRWNDVDPSWPDTRIRIFAPGTDSGTFDYFVEVVCGKTGSIRSDISTSEDDSTIVNGVTGNPAAIGFFGAAYYFQNRDRLRVVPIVNPQTGKAVVPTSDSIERGDYAPFSRPLFIYVNLNTIHNAQLEQFVEFYLDRAANLATQVGYVPLPESVYQQARENFFDELAGTHYLMPDGQKRHGPVTEIYVRENLVK